MKKLLPLLCVLLTVPSIQAYDFAAENADGVTIYYNIRSKEDNTVAVTRGIGDYTGEIRIPETVVYDNQTYTVTIIGEGAFWDFADVTSVTIPNTVVAVESNAFDKCRGLETVNFSNSLISIGDKAFNDCQSLSEVTIPDTVTSIGGWAFASCANLVSVYIPDTVTTIGQCAFSSCYRLASVTIPVSMIEIEESTFSACFALSTIDIPDNITSIGERAFDACENLTSVTFGNSVASIGPGAFTNCDGLTEIVMPESLTTIGSEAFYGCKGLKSVSIPENVTLIGNYAFQRCTALREISCHNPEPASIKTGGFVFDEVPKTDCILYVLSESLDLYRNSTPWNEFKNIEALSSAIKTVCDNTARVSRNGNCMQVSVPSLGAPVKLFDVNGRILYDGKADVNEFVIPTTLEKGMTYVVKVGNKIFKYKF